MTIEHIDIPAKSRQDEDLQDYVKRFGSAPIQEFGGVKWRKRRFPRYLRNAELSAVPASLTLDHYPERLFYAEIYGT